MDDEDYSHLDHVEVVDQEPKSRREVRTEIRERVKFLAEDRLTPAERRELEDRALEGAREVEMYEESWSPSHDADLDRIHEYVDHRLDRDRARRKRRSEERPSAGSGTTEGPALGGEDRRRLARAVPGELLSHTVQYRTGTGAVVRARYRARDGREKTTVVNLSPGRVRFLSDIREELDDADVELSDLDLEPPAPPGGEAPRPRTSEPAEPEEPAEADPAETEPSDPEAGTDDDDADEIVEDLVEPETDTTDEGDEEDWSQEDLELAEELGISPEELSDLTGTKEEKSGGLGGKLGFGKKKDEEAEGSDDAEEGGGLGGKLGFGKKKGKKGTEGSGEAEEGGGLGGKLPFGKKKEKEETDASEDDEETEGGGGLGGKLGFGKKKEASTGDDDADEDDEDEGSGGIGSKLPFGKK